MESVAQFVQNNPSLAVFAVFFGGLLSAASPCVLAIIPLVIGYVGGYAQGNKTRAIKYTLVFASGLALTFTLMGAAAGFIGSLLGFTGKYLYWGIAAVAIIMGLSLFGLFEIRMPFRAQLKTSIGGLFGAFLLGMLFGLASTPCATPVLVVILAFAASKGQVAYSTFLLFIYAIGHCALVVLAGVMTGFVDSMAQSKGATRFMAISRKTSAALLILAGLFILYLNV